MPRFYPPDARVPDELRSDEFVLRMLRATDVELDYDAVISSREQLLLRSGGDWPREGFTLAENLADLQRHEADHLARTSFTYTVMNPSETECLGCVYINPLLPLLETLNASPAERATVRDDEAWVWFWVRQSRLADNLDARLLAALRGWFADEWAFSRVLFHAIAAQTRPLRLYQMAGLAEQFVLHGKENVHFLYG